MKRLYLGLLDKGAKLANKKVLASMEKTLVGQLWSVKSQASVLWAKKQDGRTVMSLVGGEKKLAIHF